MKSLGIDLETVRAPGVVDVVFDEKDLGLNCRDFDEIVVIGSFVAPVTAATIVVYFWSEALAQYVPASPAISLSVTSAGERFIVRVGNHVGVLLALTSKTGGAATDLVSIEAAGIPTYNRQG